MIPSSPGRWLVTGAVLLALLSARPYAASFNDGSRLATVEALVDQHTFRVDQSIFVAPPRDAPLHLQPYRHPVYTEMLLQDGTLDKVRINGHYYSEKPPVQALYLAGVYQLLQWTTGLTARAQPGLFCYLMTLASSGLAYVIGVRAVWQLVRLTGLTTGLAVALTVSFALSTTALPYATHVNGHLPLLAVAGLLFLSLFDSNRPANLGRAAWWGLLCGLAYALETPTGGLLSVAAAAYVLLRFQRLSLVIALVVGALPGAVVHHLTCWVIAGTWAPINTVVEFFDYPGSAFTRATLTGFWNHAHVGEFVAYAGGMLFGNRGFLQFNLPLLLTLPAVILLWRVSERLEMFVCIAWAAATWLTFAALSNNFSGEALAIRWFEPLLVPGYYLLALLVRDRPGWRRDVWVLSLGGAALLPGSWWVGVWGVLPPGFWTIQAATLGGWLAVTDRVPDFPQRVPAWCGALLGAGVLLGLAGVVLIRLPDAEEGVRITVEALTQIVLALFVGLTVRASGLRQLVRRNGGGVG